VASRLNVSREIVQSFKCNYLFCFISNTKTYHILYISLLRIFKAYTFKA
jgi:hypothetical protein